MSNIYLSIAVKEELKNNGITAQQAFNHCADLVAAVLTDEKGDGKKLKNEIDKIKLEINALKNMKEAKRRKKIIDERYKGNKYLMRADLIRQGIDPDSINNLPIEVMERNFEKLKRENLIK